MITFQIDKTKGDVSLRDRKKTSINEAYNGSQATAYVPRISQVYDPAPAALYENGKKYTLAAEDTFAQTIMENFGIHNPNKLSALSVLHAEKVEKLSSLYPRTKVELYSIVNEDLGYGNITTGYIGGGKGISYPQAPSASNLAPLTANYTFGSGDAPTVNANIGMHIAAQAIATDLLPWIPMTMNNFQWSFLDTIYSGGSASDNNNPKRFFGIYGGIIGTTSFDYTKYKSGDTLVLVPCDSAGSTTADGKAVMLYLDSYGRYDAELRFTYKNTIGETIDYTQSTNTGVVSASIETIDTVISTSPYWAISKYGGDMATTFIDAATLQYFATTSTGLAKVTYISSTDDVIAAGATSGGQGGDPMSKAVGEMGNPNILSLKRWSASVAAKEISSMGSVTYQEEKDSATVGIDTNFEQYRLCENINVQQLNRDILDTMFRLGVRSAYKLLVAQGVNMNLYVAPSSSASKALTSFSVGEFVDPDGNDMRSAFGNIVNAVSNESGEILPSLQRRIASRLTYVKNIIATVSRQGLPDFAVMNGFVGAALEDSDGYVQSPALAQISLSKTNVYFAGNFRGLDIYIDPTMAFNDMRILVGKRGDVNTTGLKFCPYDMGSVEVMSEATMNKKIQLFTRYALLPAGFRPEIMYFTFCINSGFGDGSWL